VPDHTTPPAVQRLGFAACCLFIGLAACTIPYPGIQNDEVLFTAPLYPHAVNNIQPPAVPRLMLIGYIGTLKTLLYWPILWIFGPGVWTLRLPVVLLGSITIFIFLHLAASSLGRAAAVVAAFLLATDPVFLLTNTFDWGPVAFEHFLLVTGCWCLFRFGSQTPSNTRFRNLCFGFFCFGLALWNKAVFAWALVGLTTAGLLIFWPEIRPRLTRRNLGAAASAFLLGSSPLLAYNLRHFNATLTGNVQLDAASLPGKWIQVERALNGSSLFGVMVSEESAPNPKPATSLRGRTAVWIREHLGEHRQTGFYYVLGLLLLAAPWWWRSRPARFSLVFMIVAWIAMASTHDAGTSAHHVILLWPFPVLFAAAALTSLPWRWVTIVASIGMVGMNLLVVNQYIAQFERNGATGGFTDAIFPLSASLPDKTGEPVYMLDWGIKETVNYLHRGRLNILIDDVSTDPEPQTIHAMLTDPRSLFVGHVPGQQFFPRWSQDLDADAQASGYRKEVLRLVPDSNGRPIFEVFRYVPQ